MKTVRLAIASLLFLGSGVGLLILDAQEDTGHSRDVLGSTVEESESVDTDASTEETIEPAPETPPVDEGIQRQLEARSDSVNHEDCTDEGSVVVEVDGENEDNVNISINSRQVARSGSVTNDGSGDAVSGNVKTCNSSNINVDITNN